MLFLIIGCDAEKGRLTEAELERQTLTQKIELVEAGGGLVMMVGGETLTSDEIIDSRTQIGGVYISPAEYYRPIAQANRLEQFKERARGQIEEILMDKISIMLLYQQAKRQAGGNIEENLEKAAQNEYRKFVLNFGGDQATADEALRQRQMDQKSYIEQQKKSILIEWYRASKMPANRPATYRELVDCYDRMKDEYFTRVARITFRLIDIQPAKLRVTDPNQDRQQLAEQRARELLALIEAGEDFGELAKQHSHGDWGALGGLWRPVQPESLAKPYDILAVQADRMLPGQVAGPIMAEGHIFIMKLEEKQSAGYESFEKVQEIVKEKLMYDRQKEVLDKLNNRIKREAKLNRTDEFVDFCLEKIYRISNAGDEASGVKAGAER